jgi:hypothetical protein
VNRFRTDSRTLLCGDVTGMGDARSEHSRKLKSLASYQLNLLDAANTELGGFRCSISSEVKFWRNKTWVI